MDNIPATIERSAITSFGRLPAAIERTAITSFGYLHGAPPAVSRVWDVRRFRDPAALESLRSQGLLDMTGLDGRVNDIVASTPGVPELVDDIVAYIADTDGSVAIGCAGGRHRSVAIAELVHAAMPKTTTVVHRDIHHPRVLAPTDTCPFCKIVAGHAAAFVLRSWDDAIAIRPLNPVVAGHVIVIPRQHREDLIVDPAVTAATMVHAAELASVLRSAGGQGWNLITSAGEHATQTVPHLHVHLVPRVEGDGLTLPWTGQSGATR